MRCIFTSVMVMTLAFAIISCTSSQKDKKITFDKVAVTQAIEKERQVFMDAFNKGDSLGVANCYTSDAKFMPPNQNTASGRDPIQATISGFMKAGASNLTLKAVDVWGDETMAFTEDTWVLKDKEGKEIDHGKALVLWKMEDGKWKLFRDMFNSDLPCSPPPK
ncbi:nuclear transport factor 2 family protein [Flavobacterium sp. GT3R68]|uniref:YybH family protein n=1 Tax=Flavobacterium sp. GT3R68 TaxID=2594437 RepID=UPI00131573D1|nr:nuclear transport factor 2 family protein [Flavobacterium sp. GT3R68]